MTCYSTAFGVAIPAYASFKALESKEAPAEVNKLMAQWLTYWTIFGGLAAVESLTHKRYERTTLTKLRLGFYQTIKRFERAQVQAGVLQHLGCYAC